MHLAAADIAILLFYFAIALAIGFLNRSRRADLSGFFLSSRSLPWWLAGTGMVATTFAADTPLAVAGIVGNQGISGNWIWWSAAAGGMLTVFFYARLWRRAEVLTDLELTELRYGGRLAAALRGGKALYFGLVVNALVIGWVNLALLRIIEVLLPDYPAAVVLTATAILTLAYVTFSGLRGLTAADMFQFLVAMAGSILLAWYALRAPEVGGRVGLVASVSPEQLSFFPTSAAADLSGITMAAFFAFVGIQWWASWYPGAEPGGGGYVAQRIMSARSERDGVLATLWFVLAHYCLRPWPWILAALAGLLLYPAIASELREESFVYLIRDLLPSPWRGLLLAAFLGAYMSTLSTQLNWGSSYLVNDFYLRYLRRSATAARRERESLPAARLASVLLLVVSLYVTFTLLDSVHGAWAILLEFGAGSGFVLLLRWYWWRINAWSELTSILVPAILVLLMRLAPGVLTALGLPEALLHFPSSLFVIVSVTVVVTLLVTFLTPPESGETLERFYRRTLPSGWGWRRFAESTGVGSPDRFSLQLVGWLSGVALLYGTLFAVGAFLLYQDGLVWYLLLAFAGGIGSYWSVRRIFAARS